MVKPVIVMPFNAAFGIKVKQQGVGAVPALIMLKPVPS